MVLIGLRGRVRFKGIAVDRTEWGLPLNSAAEQLQRELVFPSCTCKTTLLAESTAHFKGHYLGSSISHRLSRVYVVDLAF